MDLSRQYVLVESYCLGKAGAYSAAVPKLWNQTIEAHRIAVRDAILDSAWALVTEQGLASVTMSRIAQKAGIGRATLYKYFPQVEAILAAWHQRHVAAHLRHLAELCERPGNPCERLEAVLGAFALIAHHRGQHDAELVALLHRGEHVVHAHQQLAGLIRELLVEVAGTGRLRDDVAPDELADYCLHALTAASGLKSEDAVQRLVAVTLSGLRPPR